MNWVFYNGSEVASGVKAQVKRFSVERKEDADHILLGWQCHWSIKAAVLLQLGLSKGGNAVLVKEYINIYSKHISISIRT